MSYDKSRASDRPLIVIIFSGAALVAAVLAIVLTVGLLDTDSGHAYGAGYRSAVGQFRHASVTTDTDICSQIGTDIMARDRGNAFDAGVAAMFCVGLVNAHSCGIGGGGFIVVYDKKNDKWSAINGREKAPGAAHRDMFKKDKNLSLRGGLASGIPGELRALWMLHSQLGLLSWSHVLQPSIQLCYDGIPLGNAPHSMAAKKFVTDELKEAFSEYFDEGGALKPVGSLIYKPRLARTLERIRDDPFTFYSGSLADDIVADNNDVGGIFTLEDLQSYEAKWDDTVSLPLPDGYVIHSINAPGSGPVLLYILNILAGYQLDPSHVASTGDEIRTYHRIVEAFKFAFAKRTELGDPDFVNISQIVADMSDPATGERIRALIDDSRTHGVDFYRPSGPVLEDHGTSHISVVDREGNVVAATRTINHYFGSKVKGARTGIIFNNQMNDFAVPDTNNMSSLSATLVNLIEPGKRPMSSMCPVIVWDSNTNTVKLTAGASGSNLIITAVALNIIDVLWLGRSLPESVDRPRLHHQLEPPQLQLEQGFPQEVMAGLRRKGHVTVTTEAYAVVQAINILADNLLVAVADYRKDGVPDGF